MKKNKNINGADGLVKTLINSGINVCFTNPGTSEMHFVAALDKNSKMKSVLCLFEGCATGAADGYYRMKNKLASTLLHLGPGLANGLANLHNAKKANSGIINIVGEHALDHIKHNAPLTSDIEGIAKPVSSWIKTSKSSLEVSADAARAIKEALKPPGKISTLILPGNTAWEKGKISKKLDNYKKKKISSKKIKLTVKELDTANKPLIIVGGEAVEEKNFIVASKIAKKFNASIMTDWFNARLDRGSGRVKSLRIPYNVDKAVKLLADFDKIILIGARKPVAFFSYPNKPSILTNKKTKFVKFGDLHEDIGEGLRNLCEYINANLIKPNNIAVFTDGLNPTGQLNPHTIGLVLGKLIPENAIIVDESITTGREFFPFTECSRPHTWLNNCGGSIGFGLPVATGAAIACPNRMVIALEGDGSAMYTFQSLWTIARENLNIKIIIFANKSYKILQTELCNMGIKNPGPSATNMLSLENPIINWVSVSKGLGIDAVKVDTINSFFVNLEKIIKDQNPFLIEVSL